MAGKKKKQAVDLAEHTIASGLDVFSYVAEPIKLDDSAQKEILDHLRKNKGALKAPEGEIITSFCKAMGAFFWATSEEETRVYDSKERQRLERLYGQARQLHNDLQKVNHKTRRLFRAHPRNGGGPSFDEIEENISCAANRLKYVHDIRQLSRGPHHKNHVVFLVALLSEVLFLARGRRIRRSNNQGEGSWDFVEIVNKQFSLEYKNPECKYAIKQYVDLCRVIRSHRDA